MTRGAWLSVLAGALLVAVVFWWQMPRGHGHDEFGEAGRHDINSVKHLAQLLTLEPARDADGRYDVYAIWGKELRKDEWNHELFHHRRGGKFPTQEEIESGDYRSFGWERGVVPQDRTAIHPVLWDARPHRGHRVVAWSNGAVRFYSEEQFQAFVAGR
ncbi:MAG: hypothetical protein AAGD14_17085 [Planctomycetota bacterium]